MTHLCMAHLSTGAVVLQKCGRNGMAEWVTCFGGHVLFNQEGKINNLENDNNIINKKMNPFYFSLNLYPYLMQKKLLGQEVFN